MSDIRDLKDFAQRGARAQAAVNRELEKAGPAPRSYSLPDPGPEPFATFKYLELAQVLVNHGWRKQDHVWKMDEPRERARDDHRIEWWNRGKPYILLYVLGKSATVVEPLAFKRFEQLLRRKDRRR